MPSPSFPPQDQEEHLSSSIPTSDIQSPDPIEKVAIEWLIRLRNPKFASWEAFFEWIEQDQGHSAIYDRLSILDYDIAFLLKWQHDCQIISGTTVIAHEYLEDL